MTINDTLMALEQQYRESTAGSIHKDQFFLSDNVRFTDDVKVLADRTEACIEQLALVNVALSAVDNDIVNEKLAAKLQDAILVLEIAGEKGPDGKALYTNETAREAALITGRYSIAGYDKTLKRREDQQRVRDILAVKAEMLRNIISFNKSALQTIGTDA